MILYHIKSGLQSFTVPEGPEKKERNTGNLEGGLTGGKE